MRREGRLTPGQQRALNELWPRFGIQARGILNLDELFGRKAPRTLEIGFGNGEILACLAQGNPDTDYLGFEVHRPGVGRLLLEAEKRQIPNLRIISEDAVQVLRRNIPDRCLDRVLILFPDPWPKQRHHKRRLVQTDFAYLLATKMKIGATVQLATDWESYAEHMLLVMEGIDQFQNMADAGHYGERPTDLPVSKFERRGQRLGHSIWNLCYRRKK